MTNQDLSAYAALLLRVSVAVMFYAHAWLKIKVFTPAGTAKYFESLGVPGPGAWEERLAIQQQRRRLGISGVLDRRPGRPVPPR